MITVLTFVVVFGVLIIVHEFGHFIVAKRLGVKVECFSVGFGPCLYKILKNKTLYKINAIPFGGYVKMAGDNLGEHKGRSDEYLSKTPLARGKIIFCGPLLNYLFGFLCFWWIFFVGYPTIPAEIGGVMEGFGAERAGLRKGDRIVSVDGRDINSWEELQSFIYTREASAVVSLGVMRNNKELHKSIELQESKLDDQMGGKRSVPLLGITPEVSKDTVMVKYGFFKSALMGLEKTKVLTQITYKALWRMLTGALSLRESVTGPIGIFYITAKAAETGVIAVLNLMGILSISLAIFNLLPLPILDGGHLALLFVEKIRGRQISPKIERRITQTGFALIVTLAILVAYNDVLRFFGDRIGSFFK